MDLNTIKEQLTAAGVFEEYGTKKEVKALPDIIQDDEQIKYAISGDILFNTVLAVLTQKRIVFVDKGLMYGIKTTEIPLDKITQVSYSKALMSGKLSIKNGDHDTTLEIMEKKYAPIMAEKIKEYSEAYKHALHGHVENASAPISSVTELDGPDQIRKYKSLLDDEIITQQEFDAKKKQILGI